ncbi:MAG TPA: DoxX family protein [Bryobacteraceae bacterium]|nr:DoxX family protein [Bryobacteraceae bacterium]
MFRRLVKTQNHWLPLVLRLTLGIVFFAHGAQKMLGWWGGGGFSATMGGFTGMGIPAPFAFLAIAAEFFGGLGLIVGFLGRIAAFGVACVMLVAIVMVHAPNGLFINWGGTQPGHGFEFHLLALALSVAIIRLGSGAVSVDWAISGRYKDRAEDVAGPGQPRRAA